jgi:hypothetical protein
MHKKPYKRYEGKTNDFLIAFIGYVNDLNKLQQYNIIIFINCNWVVTRWQYTFTHEHYIEQHKYKLLCKSEGHVYFLRVLPWHLPYN